MYLDIPNWQPTCYMICVCAAPLFLCYGMIELLIPRPGRIDFSNVDAVFFALCSVVNPALSLYFSSSVRRGRSSIIDVKWQCKLLYICTLYVITLFIQGVPLFFPKFVKGFDYLRLCVYRFVVNAVVSSCYTRITPDVFKSVFDLVSIYAVFLYGAFLLFYVTAS